MGAVEVREALIELLNADGELGDGGANAYTRQQLNDLKSDPTNPDAGLPPYYTEVWLSERDPENHRGGGLNPSRSYRIQTRAIARIEDDAEEMRKRADDRLREAYVEVGGVQSSMIVPTPGLSLDPIGPDDGWFSGLAEYVFSL